MERNRAFTMRMPMQVRTAKLRPVLSFSRKCSILGLGLFGKIASFVPRTAHDEREITCKPLVINKTCRSEERFAAEPHSPRKYCNGFRRKVALSIGGTCFSLSMLYFYPEDS